MWSREELTYLWVIQLGFPYASEIWMKIMLFINVKISEALALLIRTSYYIMYGFFFLLFKKNADNFKNNFSAAS